MNLSGRSGAPSQPDGASMIPGPHHLSLSPGCVCELTQHLHQNEHIITYTSTTYHGCTGPAWWGCRPDDVSLCAVWPYAATARGCVEGQVPLRRKVARVHQMLGNGERLCSIICACHLGAPSVARRQPSSSRLLRGGSVLLARASAGQSIYEYSTLSLAMQYSIMLPML